MESWVGDDVMSHWSVKPSAPCHLGKRRHILPFGIDLRFVEERAFGVGLGDPGTRPRPSSTPSGAGRMIGPDGLVV